MNENKSIRIKDIAEMAGVSVATVDRVLHQRGKISRESLEKVMKAMKQTGYKLNLIASTLGSNKLYRIAVLSPDPEHDDFWRQSNSGIIKAKENWSQYNIRIESFYFNMNDKPSFINAEKQAMAFSPDGMLIAPVMHREANVLFKILKEKKIPYIFFNTNIIDAEPISFIGQDLYQSGRVGAEFLMTRLFPRKNIAILHIWEDVQNGVHLKEKERGFRDYINEKKNKHFNIHSYNLKTCGENELNREITTIIKRDDIDGIFVSTSKGSSLTASALGDMGRKDIVLIGYDMLEKNIIYLKEGLINCLIHQNPEKQTFLGVSYLSNFLLFKKRPPVTDLFPLEIVTKENIDSFLNASIN